MEKKRNSHLAKLNRILIWFTFVLFAFFVICGFGIINSSSVSTLTGNVLDHARSVYFHTTLAAPVLMAVLEVVPQIEVGHIADLVRAERHRLICRAASLEPRLVGIRVEGTDVIVVFPQQHVARVAEGAGFLP